MMQHLFDNIRMSEGGNLTDGVRTGCDVQDLMRQKGSLKERDSAIE